jgi:hypothetical protein
MLFRAHAQNECSHPKNLQGATPMSVEESVETPLESAPQIDLEPASDLYLYPAVRLCTDAYQRAYKTTLLKTNETYTAEKAGKKAFRAAMPTLVGYENIRAFIACVAQAILNDTIGEKDSTKLLYAAQVALSAYRNRPIPPKYRSGF